MKGSCAICESEIVDLINKMISEETPYRVMQHDTGFAKSTLWAHRWRCLTREKLNAYKERRKTEVGQRFITVWPNGSMVLQHDPKDDDANGRPITEAELRDTDVLFRVCYVKGKVTNANIRSVKELRRAPIVEEVITAPTPTAPCKHERTGQLPGGQGTQCRDCGQQFGFHGARNGPSRPRTPL